MLVLSSCSKDDSNTNCLEYDIAYVTSVRAPSIGRVGETIEMEVDFNLKNSCGSFESFKESIDGLSRTIKINTKYEGCECLHVIVPKTEANSFKASVPGEYEFKFKSGETEYIIIFITVT